MAGERWARPADRAFREEAPEGWSIVLAAMAAQVCAPRLTAIARNACVAELFWKRPVPPAVAQWNGQGIGSLTEAEAELYEAAQMFSVDVSTFGEARRLALVAQLGAQAPAFLFAAYLADMIPRVVVVLEGLFEPSSGSWPAPAPQLRSPAEVRGDLLVGIHRLKRLDDLVSEVVRLRGAHHHHCRLCTSLRSRDALLTAGAHGILQQIATGEVEPVPPRVAAALALVDAMIWQPAQVERDTIERVRRHFSPAEAIEIVLDVMRNAVNKVAVALGRDAANVTEGVEVYQFNPDGTMTFGLPFPDAPGDGG